MLSNRPEKGLDLMDAMILAAADRASTHLAGAIRIARCDAVQVHEGFTAPEVEIEAYPVVADHQAVVVSVFATGPALNGGRATAGTGRFTFTTLGGKRPYRA